MDRLRSIPRLPLVDARLRLLLGRLARNYSLGGYRTQAELARAYAAVAKKHARGYDRRLYDIPPAKHGTPFNENEFNDVIFGLFSEVKYLLEATRGTGEMIEANFNFAAAGIQSLQAQLKSCRQNLAVFSLYARTFGTDLRFCESFSNGENLDVGSSFIEGKECQIDLSTGTITLPLIEGEAQHEIEKIEVSGSSNGVLGSNVEADTPVRGNITAMYDGNADTWTEYERVVEREDTEGLRLELKVSLKDIKPVNAVKIHPIFLGARTHPVISSIELSEDGRRWISLENDVGVAESIGETPEERFHLAPHSSRYAGEFFITFAPRFAKFLRIRIRQSSTFAISDVYGRKKLRYAIGIKELSVYGWKYEPQGELISKQITLPRPFTSIAIEPLVDPDPLYPDVGGGEYFISADDGATWLQILPLEEASSEIPEVLTFNQEFSSFRYKVRLFKNEENFGRLREGEALKALTEIHSPTLRRPQVIQLSQPPVEGTLSACNPNVATRGKAYPQIVIGTGVTSTLVEAVGGGSWERHGNTQLRIKLPIRNIVDPDELYIAVNGIIWTIVDDVSSIAGVHDENCVIRQVPVPGGTGVTGEWEVLFGNGDPTAPKGKIPGPADKISIFFSDEQVALDGLREPYTIKLDYTSSGKKSDTSIFYTKNDSYERSSEIIPAGVKRFQLAHKNILISGSSLVKVSVTGNTGLFDGESESVVGPAGTAQWFISYKDFVNGSVEIPADGDWTVDTVNGVVYCHHGAAWGGYETTVSYHWEDLKYLDDKDWDFADGKLDEIQIYQSGYHADEGEQAISLLDTAVDLTDIWGVVTKSVRLSRGVFGSYEPFEVPFIDGAEEFLGRATIQDEEVPQAVAAGATPIASFRLTHWANLVPTAGVFFDDPAVTGTFSIQKDSHGGLVAQGDWYVDTNGSAGDIGYCYVVLAMVGAQIPSGITVSYQYRDPFATEKMKGAYSVNSKEGKIYFAMPVPSVTGGTVYFKHTPYRVRYNISEQLVEGEDYTLDAARKRLSISADAPDMNYLLVSYKYKEEFRGGDLAPYFSPLLRALVIKAV